MEDYSYAMAILKAELIIIKERLRKNQCYSLSEKTLTMKEVRLWTHREKQTEKAIDVLSEKEGEDRILWNLDKLEDKGLPADNCSLTPFKNFFKEISERIAAWVKDFILDDMFQRFLRSKEFKSAVRKFWKKEFKPNPKTKEKDKDESNP